ncbi:GNAT family N-acetyltransferase [Virgibacillus sp. NKC19-3]|uniref:GNAT family N-acetyltransferase n=1 Tax=Virgibacillus saliphilus TaxID=2831674 RepID=UPI001C9AC04C|nr:GNAT family N-acetyltransferase [Virgibacillus sp. NKC19-3]MBY7143110.1 GNAT family N-acetyltransferase [Virgibacillus sp. NKC19-3]
MNWYDKLSKYFPVEEMKSKAHMEMLLDEKGDVYHKDESSLHVLMFAEFDSFVFIDYVWVSPDARGQGTGHKLMEKLKNKNKPIILEVEPVDYDDSDSEKRLHFYHREGFAHAQKIDYNRRSLATNEDTAMEILYWSPTDDSEEVIFQKMKKMYEDIHTYKDKEIYGKSYQSVDEVLTYEKDRDSKDILEGIHTTEKS